MRSMRIALLCLFTLVAVRDAQAQLSAGPKDGAGLLEYCQTVEFVTQPVETRKILPEKQYQEILEKYRWRLGYVEATMDAAFEAHVTFEVADQFSITLAGTKHHKEKIKARLQIACFPAYASANGLIYVLNKWLTEHPERLNETRSSLTIKAFGSRFPCADATPNTEQKAIPPSPNWTSPRPKQVPVKSGYRTTGFCREALLR